MGSLDPAVLRQRRLVAEDRPGLLYDLASTFHALWTRGKDETALRFVVPDDRDLTLARLALVRGVGTVIASGLRLIGVEPVEEMR